MKTRDNHSWILVMEDDGLVIAGFRYSDNPRATLEIARERAREYVAFVTGDAFERITVTNIDITGKGMTPLVMPNQEYDRPQGDFDQ